MATFCSFFFFLIYCVCITVVVDAVGKKSKKIPFYVITYLQGILPQNSKTQKVKLQIVSEEKKGKKHNQTERFRECNMRVQCTGTHTSKNAPTTIKICRILFVLLHLCKCRVSFCINLTNAQAGARAHTHMWLVYSYCSFEIASVKQLLCSRSFTFLFISLLFFAPRPGAHLLATVYE